MPEIPQYRVPAGGLNHAAVLWFYYLGNCPGHTSQSSLQRKLTLFGDPTLFCIWFLRCVVVCCHPFPSPLSLQILNKFHSVLLSVDKLFSGNCYRFFGNISFMFKSLEWWQIYRKVESIVTKTFLVPDMYESMLPTWSILHYPRILFYYLQRGTLSCVMTL